MTPVLATDRRRRLWTRQNSLLAWASPRLRCLGQRISNHVQPEVRRTCLEFILWVIFGLLLSLVPLVFVAAMELGESDTGLLKHLTNEELLAVAFALGGASGVDALMANGPSKSLQAAVGGLTVFSALVTVGLYVMLKGHMLHLAANDISQMEFWAFVGTATLSFLSEVIAEL